MTKKLMTAREALLSNKYANAEVPDCVIDFVNGAIMAAINTGQTSVEIYLDDLITTSNHEFYNDASLVVQLAGAGYHVTSKREDYSWIIKIDWLNARC